jgi:hypothetical protein
VSRRNAPLQVLQLSRSAEADGWASHRDPHDDSGLALIVLMKGGKPMQVYTPIDRVAQKLNVTVEKLWILQAFGWVAEKNGTHFVREDHEDKAKFILHLQDVLKLTPQQISTVLLAQEPHYSLKDVPRVLAGTPPSKQTYD